ncbi:methyltransferase domain-containing protein [Schaalia cardiffensis]
MQCEHWDRGACRSCRYLDVPYGEQVAAKSETAAEALALVPTAAGVHWLSPRRSAPTAFRTSAKLVVGGTRRRPTLGILGPDRRGVDLPGCPIQHPAINRATPALKRFIRSLDLIPYDVPTKNGELKYILLTVGADEIILSKRRMLPIRAGDLDLALGPGSFIQTNAAVAGDLYRQAADWAALPLASGDAPQTLWDLYCGIGGFALHTANAGIPRVTGVEVSERAIASAIRSASQAGLSRTAARFIAADATAWAAQQDPATAPDVLIVNPPRRGIGDALAQWVNEHAGERVIYSSCNPTSLARDLEAMPAYRCVEARLFDMFPHTDHVEVAVLLRRTPS